MEENNSEHDKLQVGETGSKDMEISEFKASLSSNKTGPSIQ
jgi:hypothetical protein